LDLIHDAELVATANKKALSELIKAGLKHSTLRAVACGTSMVWVHGALGVLTSAATLRVPTMKVLTSSLALERILAATAEPIVAGTAWDWVGAPLSAVRGGVSLGRDFDVSMGAILKVDCGICLCEFQGIALEALLSDS